MQSYDSYYLKLVNGEGGGVRCSNGNSGRTTRRKHCGCSAQRVVTDPASYSRFFRTFLGFNDIFEQCEKSPFFVASSKFKGKSSGVGCSNGSGGSNRRDASNGKHCGARLRVLLSLLPSLSEKEHW